MASYTDSMKKLRKAAAQATEDPRDKLIEELEKLESEYEKRAETSSDLPEPPKYDRLQYDTATDEEIEKNAEDSLADYKNSSIESIEEEAKAAKAAKEAEKNATRESAERLAASITSQYDEAMSAFSDDALKRGLARSSIVANKSAELMSGKAAALSEASMAAEQAVRAIDSEINELEASRRKALDDFNIRYAAKVTEKIAELREERDKKTEEMIKYNNSLAEQEQKDALERAEAASKLYSDKLERDKQEKELGSSTLATLNRAKYDAVRNYLSTLSRSEASNAVRSDPMLRAELSDYYFYSLYNEFCK